MSALPVLQYFKSKCISCGGCCQTRNPDLCPSGALVLNGKETDINDVFQTILRDKEFYATSGGGVTISGGEPLLQASAVALLLEKCREHKLHTAVDTAGYVPFKNFEAVLDYTDLFLYDLKMMDDDKHLEYIGVRNGLVLDNFKKLYDLGKNIIVRVPVIPGVNDGSKDMEMLADFLKDFPGVGKPELLPMHTMATGKYESMGLANEFHNSGRQHNET